MHLRRSAWRVYPSLLICSSDPRWCHKTDLFPGGHQALIDRDLWEQAQAIRRKRGRGKGGGRQAHRIYLLAGLAKCHICRLPLVGQTYSGRDGKERPYLRDVADRRGFDCPCGGHSTRTEPLDEQIGELICRLVLPDDWRAQVVDIVGCDDQRTSIEQERARLSEKLRRLQRAYFDVELDEPTYCREWAETQVQIQALVIPEEHDVLAAGRFVETLADVWEEPTSKERKELLGLILDAVFIDVMRGRVVCVQPQAAYATLFRQVPGVGEQDDCFHFS